MASRTVADNWAQGAKYEPYVGRWSRLVARELLVWLAAPPAGDWLDAGCGTGALTQTLLAHAAPRRVRGLDRSHGFVAHARARTGDGRAEFALADAQALPLASASCDGVVSGLVINFVPRPAAMAAELARVTRPGGTVAAYVWDYAGDMQFLRHFWDAAAALDPAAAALDEGPRFPLCRPEPLAALFEVAGLTGVTVRAIDVPTVFRDFDDFWTPFLGGQGPAPSYTLSLDDAGREALRARLFATLPREPDGSIHLIARAWAVRGEKS
jgi:SAM-dependent methyltransferase